MGFFKIFTDFFESLFSHSSGDAKTKSELKKIETELRMHSPSVYKNGFVQEGILEAFYILYKETKPIDNILSETICAEEVQYATSFSNKLIMTGFSSEARDLYNSLSFENRKTEVLNASSEKQIYEQQQKKLVRLMEIMKQSEFFQINSVIGRLKQLHDICRFNYFSTIRIFDPDFSSEKDFSELTISSLPVNALEVAFMDLYYICSDFQLTNTLAKAVTALACLRYGYEAVNQDELLAHMKKISYVFRHILTSEVLRQLVCLCKKDAQFHPQIASYSSLAVSNYMDHIKTQYEIDTQRIKTEVQDEQVSAEIKELFGERSLETLEGYNAEQDAYLQQNGVAPFIWLTPMQVLKTFITIYINDRTKALLNDVVVEGYFNNPGYKSDFSAAVFSAVESSERIKSFEDTFARGGANDTALMRSYVRDGHQDPDFAKKLAQMVLQINTQAKQLIQNETSQIANLEKRVKEMIEDAKTISPANISNIKMLLYSTRNKENSDLLESRFSDWKIFLDIMKNYAIIGDIG